MLKDRCELKPAAVPDVATSGLSAHEVVASNAHSYGSDGACEHCEPDARVAIQEALAGVGAVPQDSERKDARASPHRVENHYAQDHSDVHGTSPSR